MANSLIIDSLPANYNAFSTQFVELFGDGAGGFVQSGLASLTEELILSSGTLSNFWIRVTTNTNSNSTTLTFIKNGLNGNESISVNANTTGTFTDTLDTDGIAANDLVSMKMVFGTTGITFQMSILAFTFASDIDTVTKMLSTLNQDVTNNTSSNTYFRSAFGNTTGSISNTEAQCKNRQRKAGKYRNCGVHVRTNTSANASTWRSRKNGANGLISISIGAGTTGDVTDTANSDSVSPGDDFCYSHTTGASTVNIEITWAIIDFASTAQDSIHSSSYDGGITINTAVTDYWALAGDLNTPLSTESDSQILVNSAYTFSELTINVQSNGITNASTLTLRANGADTSLAVSIGNQQTGVVSDSINTDNYTAASTDQMNYKLVTAAQGTSMNISHISSWANLSPPAPTGLTGFPYSFKNLVRRAMDWKLETFGAQRSTFGI